MAREWMEELVDHLLYMGLLLGVLYFFIQYQGEACKLRCAELIAEDFLYVAAADGRITMQEYQNMLVRMKQVDLGYEVQVARIGYELQPCYAQISQSALDRYYMERNVRQAVVLQEISYSVTDADAEGLKLQKETNASVMGGEEQEYLPLPGEVTALRVEAVRPEQEVYEGEMLITVCRVSTERGTYYVEAEVVSAWESGTVWLEVAVEGIVIRVPVEVLCHPRYVQCANQHVIVNTEEVVNGMKNEGILKCVYCAAYPDKIECHPALLYKTTGCKLTKEEIWLEVCYMDGHRERITPDLEEWQDNYDETYCGIQQVTICYRGLEETVTVISENGGCKNCASACNERSLEDYNKFPYCTVCMSEVLLFTGKTYYEEQIKTLDSETELLQKNGEIRLDFGEYLIVTIKKDGEYQSIRKKMVQKTGRSR